MVAGMKFLSKKGFNPTNHSNQKKVWEREQEEKNQTQRVVERQKQLQREKDDEELALSRGDIPRVQFLYNDPTQQTQKQENNNHLGQTEPITRTEHNDNTRSLLHRQPGDDDAAAAFRQMMFMAESEFQNDYEPNGSNKNSENLRHPKIGTVLQGSSVERTNSANDDTNGTSKSASVTSTALEKAVGKKQSSNTALSLQEQMERFPQLKYAPRAKGMSMTDVNVSFKPLGAQIRNVKCLVCGIWGHSKGDRECAQSGWDPFSTKIALPHQSQFTYEAKKTEGNHKSPTQNVDKLSAKNFIHKNEASYSSQEDRSSRRKGEKRSRDEKGERRSCKNSKKHSKKHRKDKTRRKRHYSNSDSEDFSDDENVSKKKRSTHVDDNQNNRSDDD